MNLATALAVAIGNHQQAQSSPAPQSLLGQLLDIARNTDQGRAGRPAEALGVSPATWNKWLSGARGVKGGTTPNAASQKKIDAAVKNIHKDPTATTPMQAVITADVEWNGYYNPGRHRTVHLDGLELEEAFAAYEAGNGSEEAFLAALYERYEVPIGLTKVDSIHFR